MRSAHYSTVLFNTTFLLDFASILARYLSVRLYSNFVYFFDLMSKFSSCCM
jgi:hypothetical protein